MSFGPGILAIGYYGVATKVAGNRRAWLCAVMLSLLAACTHRDQDSAKAPADHLKASADHWGNIDQVTIVAARDGDAYLSASCYYGPTLALMSTQEVTGQPASRVLALGFDGSTPAPQKWVSRAYAPPRWGFETGKPTNADFRQTLTELRTHREVEALVEEAGREVLHVHFSLAGANDALAQAFQNCPP